VLGFARAIVLVVAAWMPIRAAAEPAIRIDVDGPVLVTLGAPRIERRNAGVRWRFDHPDCRVEAEVVVPPDGASPAHGR